VIRRKMELDLTIRGRVVKPGTPALILLEGSRRVPVTESSAHYMLANMILKAEVLGLGSCLMDSLLLTFRTSRRLRKTLGIREDVLGVLSLGYPGEKILNIPRGYSSAVRWNGRPD